MVVCLFVCLFGCLVGWLVGWLVLTFSPLLPSSFFSSAIPVSFQFVVEDKGTFQFDRTYGVIPPNLQSHVIIRFDPEVSGNFCRRIFCLLKDQLPVAIDCVGTAYNDL